MPGDPILRGLDGILGHGTFAAEQVFVAEASERPVQPAAPRGAHVHDSWELFVPVLGALQYWVLGGPLRRLGRWQALLVPPRTVHLAYDPQRQPPGTRLSCFVAAFDKPTSAVTLMDVAHGRQHTHSLAPEEMAAWTEALGSAPAQALGRIGQIRQRTDTGHTAACVQAWLRLLLATLHQVLATRAASAPSPAERAVQQGLAHLRQRYADPRLSLREIARAAELTPTYFATIYKRFTGGSVRQALIRFRLERAEALLRSGRFSVKEAATLSGWSSASHFSAAFRKHYSFPPSRLARETESVASSAPR